MAPKLNLHFRSKRKADNINSVKNSSGALNLKSAYSFLAAHFEIMATILVFVAAYGFIIWQLDLGLVLKNTHLTGGDTGSHVYIPYYLKQIFPRLKWWSPDWYSGFPFLYFYPPLLYIVTVVLGFIIPLNIAFKLVVVSGVLIFPLAFYASLKWLDMKFPIPQIGAIFSLFLIFLESYTIYGGNLVSLLAGQFSHTLSIALLFMFVGLMYKGLKSGKYLSLNMLLGVAVILTHPISGIILIILPLFFIFQTKGLKKNLLYISLVYFGIFLLSAFWTLGLVWYKGYSGGMKWIGAIKLNEVFPTHWIPLIAAAGLGVVYAIWKKDRRLLGVAGIFWIAIPSYIYLNNSNVWNTRFLPYISFGILFLAAYFLGSLASYLKKMPIILAIILTVIVGLSFYQVKTNTKFASNWFSWNFEGYESKSSWPEVDGLFNYLKTLPQGRVMWEYRPEYNTFGTPRVLETVPVFSGQPTYEGLLIESGITGPFHFVNQAETTDKPTAAIAGFEYPPFDLNKGVKHLQMSGASYFVAYSDLIRQKANTNSSLQKLSDVGQFSVYKVKDSKMVEPIRDFELTKKDKGWLQKSFDWYKKADPQKPLVFGKDEEELNKVKPEGAILAAEQPENVSQTKDSIEFDVKNVGVPQLVKVSYFPTWRAEGAKGPYLVSPAYMMVIPTEKHVKLYFAYGWVDWLGMGLSVAGLGYLLLARRMLSFRIKALSRTYCHSELDSESRNLS